MKDLAKRAEVHQIVENVQNSHRQGLDEVYKWATPLDLASKMQQAQVDLNRRVQAVETTLPCKVDRSDLNDIETLAARLRLYDSFQRSTEVSIADLLQETQTSSKRHDFHDEDLKNVHELVDDLNARAAGWASSAELRQVGRLVSHHSDAISTLATREVVDELSIRVTSCEGDITSLSRQSEAQVLRIGVVEDAIETKASSAELRQYVPRSHYEQVITALGSDVDSRATCSDLLLTTQRVQVQFNQINGDI